MSDDVTSNLQALLANAERYAQRFDQGDLPASPARKLAVIACMDARIDVAKILGLREGDAHVIRNAGGIVTEHEIRALAVSQRRLATEEVVVLQHTDCGMRSFTDEQFRSELRAETGHEPGWEPHEFSDPVADVCEAMARIRESPFVPFTDHVRGSSTTSTAGPCAR